MSDYYILMIVICVGVLILMAWVFWLNRDNTPRRKANFDALENFWECKTCQHYLIWHTSKGCGARVWNGNCECEKFVESE